MICAYLVRFHAISENRTGCMQKMHQINHVCHKDVLAKSKTPALSSTGVVLRRSAHQVQSVMACYLAMTRTISKHLLE